MSSVVHSLIVALDTTIHLVDRDNDILYNNSVSHPRVCRRTVQLWSMQDQDFAHASHEHWNDGTYNSDGTIFNSPADLPTPTETNAPEISSDPDMPRKGQQVISFGSLQKLHWVVEA